ncbi:MAG: restriction endonuclease subunit S [Ferrovum myxofaciens]
MEEQTDSKVPQIRFKGFEAEWEEKTLGSISESYSGGTPSVGNRSYYNGTIPFIRSGEINSTTTELKITEAGLKNSSAKLVKKDDVLYALYGATSGEVGVSQIDGAINQAILAIKPRSGYYTHFLAIWLRCKKDSIVRTYLQGGQGNLSGDIVKSLVLALPDVTEQTQIGTYFQELDRLIGLHQRKHDKLVTLKKAMLQKMFPQPGATTPEIRFKGFEGEWVEKKIHEMFQVTRGNVLAATKTSPKQTNEAPYPVYSSQTKNNGLMGYYKSYLFEDAITWTTDGANAGTVCYREGKFYSTNVNGVLLSDRGYANRAVSESLNQEAWKHVSHVGNPKLMNNVMSQIKIFVPDTIAEQQEIGNYFRTLDELISKHATQLQKLQQIKSACLEKMFI